MTRSVKALLGVVVFAASLRYAGAQSTRPQDTRPTSPTNPPDSRGATNPPAMTPADPQDMKPTAKSGGMSKEGVTGVDNHWITKAAQGGMAEVELGKLAHEKGSSDAVKQFGQRMVVDHSKAGDELSQLAQSKGVTVPASIDPKSQSLKDKLSKLEGAAFDRAYMSEMVKDHRTDVAEFQKEANSGKDMETKSFAAKTLPTLQEHLRMAEETSNAVKK